MESAIILFAFGLAANQWCLQWKEIVPCSCNDNANGTILTVSCEGLTSYAQLVNALQNKFKRHEKIFLKIANSKLDDLPQHTFKELNITLENLKLNYDDLSNVTLSANSFEDLPNINYLSLADNDIGYIPEDIFKKMPSIKTLDLGNIGLDHLKEGSFKSLPYLQHLVLARNEIKTLEKGSIPNHIRNIHIGRNFISDLNETLVSLSGLHWVFLNNNNLTTLEGQLPLSAPDLYMIHGAHNLLEKVPKEIKNYHRLQSLFLNNNQITELGTTLAKLGDMQRIQLEHNLITEISAETFAELQKLEHLLLGHNRLTAINNAFLPLSKVEVLNLTHNFLAKFSFEEVKGLRILKKLDLSHNRIKILHGPTANLVEWETKIGELNLSHNYLQSLNGVLSGLPSLTKLDLSHNKILSISPDDFIGLEQLMLLDVSHNQLTTLNEMSKTFLPSLTDLIAAHNKLSILDRDFHGLPVLCWADLSTNQIVALGRELVSNTRCNKGAGILKVYLQDNPILCDAALPEIVRAMEINFTRIHGVSHCGPLSEQPTTSKPNGYLGILPSSTPIPLSRTMFNHQALTVQSQPSTNLDIHQLDTHNKLNDQEQVLLSPTLEKRDHQAHNFIRHNSKQENSYTKFVYSLSDYTKNQEENVNQDVNNNRTIENIDQHNNTNNSSAIAAEDDSTNVEDLKESIQILSGENDRIEPPLEIEQKLSRTPN